MKSLIHSLTLRAFLLVAAFGCAFTARAQQPWLGHAATQQIWTNPGAPAARVGIRTTDPAEALEVVGNSLLRGQVGVNTSLPSTELSVRGQMSMSTIGIGTSAQDKISLYLNRLGDDAMVGFGFETEVVNDGGLISNERVLTNRAEWGHRWYIDHTADAGVSSMMTLRPDGLGLFEDNPQAGFHVNAPTGAPVIYGQYSGDPRFLVTDAQAGFGTVNPLADLHLASRNTTAQFLVTPGNSSSGGDAEILLGEDDDFSFGMALRYDGAANRFYVMGNAPSGVRGPHLSIERDNGDVGIGYGTAAVPAGFKMATAGDVLVRPALGVADGQVSVFIGEDGDNGLAWRYNGGSNKLMLDGYEGGSFQGAWMSIERNNGDIGLGYGGANIPAGFKIAAGGSMLLRPDLSVLDGTVSLMLGEDHDNGLVWRYDGVGNNLHLDGYSGGAYQGTHMTVERTSGDVTIGYGENTAPAGYKLAVEGEIIAEGLTVELSGDWPDFVFDAGYELIPIRELASRIGELGHLPGVPPEAQVKAGGLDVAEMQRIHMQKIEELTLYVIELQRQLDEVRGK